MDFLSSSLSVCPIAWSEIFIKGSKKLTDCGINPISFPLSSSLSFCDNVLPLYFILPFKFAFFGNIPKIAWARRLLPDPLEPSTANISPSDTSSVKSVITFKSL